MKKPKVLHIFSGYGGGISSLILNLVENSYQYVDYTLLAFSYEGGDAFKERLRSVGSKLLLMSRPRIEGFTGFVQSVKRVFEENHYDAVHCHIDAWPMIIFRLIANKYGVKTFIVHAHKTLYEKRIDRVFRFVNRSINRLFSTNYMTCSRWAAEYLFGRHFLKKRKAYLIPNGINESIFREKITQEDQHKYNCEFNVSEKELVIAHVGRFNEQKNHGFILNLASKLIDDQFSFKLLLIGDGELLESMQGLSQKMNLSNHVVFLGRRLDVSKIMQYADLLILPSLWEGLPTVAVECQASGTPMLLADTITPECDMGLDLVNFLPLDIALWSNHIEAFEPHKVPIIDSIQQICNNSFTAHSSGLLYCNILIKMIKDNNK